MYIFTLDNKKILISIPYSSDKTFDGAITTDTFSYISIPYSSDKTTGTIQAGIGLSQSFLSHIVQIKHAPAIKRRTNTLDFYPI